MPSLAIYPLLSREGAPELARRAIRMAEGVGADVMLPPEEALALDRPELGQPLARWRGATFALTLGGDGTLLAAATELAPLGVPLLGLNLGRVGFLTELELRDFEEGLRLALAGRLLTEERMMIEGTVLRSEAPIGEFIALNDLVITKGPFARLVRLTAWVEGSPLGRYSADGLILATPTGSTAYALSAGGPVLAPEVEAILITPICPHSLDARSIVVPPGDTVTVEIAPMGDRSEVFLTNDGQLSTTLFAGDRLIVRKSGVRTRLLRQPGYDFFQVLRRKLSEGVL